jgi:hypothetical protein
LKRRKTKLSSKI